MEWAIGERVDGEDVEIFAVEKPAKLVEHRRRAQRLSGDPREPKTKSEYTVRRYSRLDVCDMSLEALAHLVPALAGVDVGTVGEMRARQMTELHEFRPLTCRVP